MLLHLMCFFFGQDTAVWFFIEDYKLDGLTEALLLIPHGLINRNGFYFIIIRTVSRAPT